MGDVSEGEYGKYGGHLVMRMGYEDFAQRWQIYSELKAKYDYSIQRGDTVNDAVVQMIDEHAADLLIPTTLASLFKTGDTY